MSNPKDNWRELAELLGLPTDEPAPAPSPAAPPPPAVSSRQEFHEPEPVAEKPLPPPFADEEVVEPMMDAIVEDAELGDVPPAAPPEGDEPPREERRGRRRGRRGRRRGRDEAPEGAEAPAEPKAEGEPHDAEPRGHESRDDRDRPRRHRSEAAEADAPVAVADDEGDTDDFSQDAWADWNVPNWQELIDGLYRPDRDR